MLCPECGHEMGKRAKCLRCGYTIKDIVPVDPEKIEQEEPREEEPVRKEVNPDQVHVSRAGGGSIFGDIFGGGLFGGLFGSLFGDFFDDGVDGYEYDPKYYDDFGNEIDLPDEFERESVEIRDAEVIAADETEPPKKEPPRTEKHRPQDFFRRHRKKHGH